VILYVLRWPHSDKLFQFTMPETASEDPLSDTFDLIVALDEERCELYDRVKQLETALRDVLREAIDDYYQEIDPDGILARARAALEG
jgi:hypothetical protein